VFVERNAGKRKVTSKMALFNYVNDNPLHHLQSLIHFNGGKYFANKPQRGQGSHGSSYEENGEGHQKHVPKVEHVRHEHATRLQPVEPENAVHKRVKGCAPRSNESKPPPAMIFRTKLVIYEQHRQLGARNQENQEYNERKAKDIIELVHPHAGHDEKELDVGSGKRDNAGSNHVQLGVENSGKLRNSSGNGRSHGRKGDGFGLVSKVGTQKDHGNGDTAPHGRNDNDVKNWDRTGTLFEEENNVEE
jgi:hypothetical protein